MGNKILLLSVMMFFGFSVLSWATPVELKNRHVILDYTPITLRQPPVQVGRAFFVEVNNVKNTLAIFMSELKNTSAPAPLPKPSTTTEPKNTSASVPVPEPLALSELNTSAPVPVPEPSTLSELKNASAPAPVPEPSTLFLLGCGIIWSVSFSKRYRQRKE